MKPETRAGAEAWLDYFAELKISPFYLDRAKPSSNLGEPEMPVSHAVQISQSPQNLAGPPAIRAKSRNPFAAQPKAETSAPLPVIKSASLFEAGERVTNDSLELIRERIGDCKRCRLCQQRNTIVFGSGSPHAELVFIGEGPGRDEDIQGLPFVGRAGKLLTQMIEAMGLKRDDVYICNVVKCRPPENRAPEPDEMETCSPFLYRQLAVINPKAIVCLGAIAFQALYGSKQSISRLRGQWLEFRGIPMMATYHPAYLLRNPNAKGDVWEDLKKVMVHLGLKIPSKT
ncbi:MAG TPA: uracil-DNA glycosylase [Candidatus Acidoferrales bacterium]|nr:uracil-DNA glycosylase [Candidatus Acidoferrales bacterium]